MRPADTAPEAWAMQMARLRALTPSDRGRMAVELSEVVEALTITGIRQRHPDYTDDQVLMALRRLRLGDDVTRAAGPGAELPTP